MTSAAVKVDVVLIFGQSTKCESLIVVISALNSAKTKLEHKKLVWNNIITS